MVDKLSIQRELPRGFFPANVARAWDAIWDNFNLLREAVGYQDVTFTPTAGSNEVEHKLGVVPLRWMPIRSLDVTGYVTEDAATEPTATTLTILVEAIGSDPSLTLRVWRP